RMITRFWHVGMTVDDLDKAVEQYEVLGYKVTQRFDKEEPQAIAAHLEHPTGSDIELWQWQDRQHLHVQFMKNHIALISDNIDDDVWALVEQGAEVVIPKTTGVLVTFVFVRDPSGNY